MKLSQFNIDILLIKKLVIKTHTYSFLCILLSIFLISCTSISSSTYGPIADSDFQNIFISSINDNQQEILFYSRAIWYPNKNGFKFFPAGKKSKKGIIVVTDQAVYFSAWSSNKKYSPEFSTNYEQIELVRHAANDLLGRVVIKKTQQKNQFNSFEILGVEGTELPDKAETVTAFKIIQQLAAG